MSTLEKQGTRQVAKKFSTVRNPYHYFGAGLPNVYLVGVEYLVDRVTGEEMAGIPRLITLLEALGKVVVEKPGPLTSDELRFLRKRLRIASKDFAGLVGMSVEQYSRVENGATITPMLDRMVRLLYATLAKLQPDVAEGVARVTWEAKVTGEQKIVASQDAENRWVVTTKAA